MKSDKKNTTSAGVKWRNWLAVDARQRHTAGQMGDKRKEQSKKACRGKAKED
jgi:hypothetical protein